MMLGASVTVEVRSWVINSDGGGWCGMYVVACKEVWERTGAA